MNRTPRKNLQGFHSHLQGIVNRLVREEFPGLGDVCVASHVFHEARNTAAAHWYECKNGERIYRAIFFNLDAPWSREEYLKSDDDNLRDVIRHELLHGEMRRRGLPWRDDDVPFILECLRRRLPVNLSSVAAMENVHGRGAFEFFQTFLPPAETEPISLAEGGGVWLREK